MRVRTPIAVTLAAVMAVGSLGISAAPAAPIGPLPAAQHSVDVGGQVIQVASKKKRHRGNNAAAAAAFAGIAGAMIGLAIQESQRDRYYDRYGYYDGGRPYYRGHYYRAPAPRHYYHRHRGLPPGYGAPPIENHGLDR